MARYSPNPFYVHPGGDLSRGLDGLGQVLAENRAAKEEKAAQEAQQQRIQMAQQAARQALQSGDPMMVADVAMEYPEVADMLNKQAGIIDEAKKQDATQFSMALLAAAPEDRAAVYQQRIKQLSEQGRDPSHTMQSYRDYLADPEREIRGVETMFAATNPDAYKSYREATTVKPAETREIKRGDRIVTEQWDGEKWVQIADAARFNPKAGVNIDFGGMMGGAPELGKLSTDYGYVLDPETRQPVINPETGLPVAAPVPGSKAAKDIQDQLDKERGRQTQRERAGGTVIQDLNRARNLLPEIPEIMRGNNIVSGLLTKASESLPRTTVNQISQLKESALSNVGLDTLQQMRENSPTGGALGQVPIQQQQRLEQVLGSLDVNQPVPVLDDNLKRVMNIYTDIVHGTPAERAVAVERGMMTQEESDEIDSYYLPLSFDERGNPINESAPSANADVPDGVDPELWEFMTPEQKALWK